MARFVTDANPDDVPDSKGNSKAKSSQYRKHTSGKVIEDIATGKAIHQSRYEEDAIQRIYATNEQTAINSASDLSQTHKAGTKTNISHQGTEYLKNVNGDQVTEKTGKHQVKIQAQTMQENVMAQIHQLNSLGGYSLNTPKTESFQAQDNIVINSATYNAVGKRVKSKGKKAGGVATTGKQSQGSLQIKTKKYHMKSTSAINFMPSVSGPNMNRKVNRKIDENQWAYDEVKWDQAGVYQIQDLVYEPVSQTFYFLDDVQCHTQHGEAADYIGAREKVANARQISFRQNYMQSCQKLLVEVEAFQASSQLSELIHFGGDHFSYCHQTDLEAFKQTAITASPADFDDDQQSLNIKKLTQDLQAKLGKEIVENAIEAACEDAYQGFRKLVGLYSGQSLMNKKAYNATAAARVFRYAVGSCIDMGFADRKFYLPLTQTHEIKVDFAQGSATVAGYFPNEKGNVIRTDKVDFVGQGIFIAELTMELSGFAGASFLLSEQIGYQGKTQTSQDNPNIDYPYLETQSKAEGLNQVPYGNKITGDLGWLLASAEHQSEVERDHFSIIAKAGGQAELPQDLPSTFKIYYQQNAFYVAMNSAWLYEPIHHPDFPQYTGDVMPFVVTQETMVRFIQFFYYQTLNKLSANDFPQQLIDQAAYQQLNELVAYGIWGNLVIDHLANNSESAIAKVKQQIEQKKLNRNDLANAINSGQFDDVYPYATAYVKGRWLYALLHTEATDNNYNQNVDITAIEQALNNLLTWIQEDTDHQQVMQNYLPFSNISSCSLKMGQQQFMADQKQIAI